MAVFSKYNVLDTSCKAYVHPWSDSCTAASLDLLLPCLKESFRIYLIAYSVALIMRKKVPSKDEIKQTILGIIRSCIFLTSHGIGYSAVLCFLRRILGNFNFLTVSFLPSFLSSIISILIERPSRRGLLSLYVTNVASETLFKMLVSRNLIKPIRYGEVLVFSSSIAYLLYFFKGRGLPRDPIYSLLRFLVGPYDEHGFCKEEKLSYPPTRQFLTDDLDFFTKLSIKLNYKFKEIIHKIKILSSHPSCPHPFSCLYYILQGSSKTFAVGLVLQLALKIIMNLKKLYKRPSNLKNIVLQKDILRLGATFASFTALFRGVACLLRRCKGSDSDLIAIPAGFIAGLAFYLSRDTTIALYFMWKTFQISYNLGVEKGYFVEVPYASVFFHAFSTAILFHVAIVEPQNLRPSYWKFLQSMSNGRVAQMDRKCIDAFGLKTSESLAAVLARENKVPILSNH